MNNSVSENIKPDKKTAASIVLASGSPRRRELLAGLGLSFEIVKSDADETLPAGISPEDAVALLAERKARAVAGLCRDDALVIAADTVVALGGDILGKPADEEDSARMLSSLSGREHRVCTGIALSLGGRLVSCTETTAVRFRALADTEILEYIKTGEPADKAGAYGIQGLGSLFVTGITGDYFNVVGLPLCRLSQLCRESFGFSLYDMRDKRDDPTV